jgi:excisionase family DNA binding protein
MTTTEHKRISYTVAEVAAMTGMSKRRVYQLAETGEMRCKRAGRRIYIPVDEPQRWINST